jgi:hypothetical protein
LTIATASFSTYEAYMDFTMNYLRCEKIAQCSTSGCGSASWIYSGMLIYTSQYAPVGIMSHCIILGLEKNPRSGTPSHTILVCLSLHRLKIWHVHSSARFSGSRESRSNGCTLIATHTLFLYKSMLQTAAPRRIVLIQSHFSSLMVLLGGVSHERLPKSNMNRDEYLIYASVNCSGTCLQIAICNRLTIWNSS